MTVGALIDKVYDADQIVKELERQIGIHKRKRDALKEKLLAKLNQQVIESGAGKRARAHIVKRVHVNIKDRAKLEAYVKKNDALDLFQNRINMEAYKARIENGEKVPGTDTYEDISVTVTRR